MKIIVSFFVILWLAGCTQTPVIVESEYRDVGATRLFAVDDVAFDEFFVRPSTELQGYRGVYFEVLALENLVIDSRRLDHRDRPWEFTEKEKARLQASFVKEVETVFGQSEGLKLMSAPGPETLVVTFELVEFVPNASKDDARRRVNRQKVLTRSVGDLSVKGTVVDAQTKALMGIFSDEEEVGDTGFMEVNNKVNNARHIRNTMESWVRTLKKGIEGIQ